MRRYCGKSLSLSWPRFARRKSISAVSSISASCGRRAVRSIIEFNVRFGDPETQVLLPLIDTPLVEIFQAVREQRLGKLDIRLNSKHAVTIVMAAAGYPGTPETGAAIEGLDSDLPARPFSMPGPSRSATRL